MTKRDIDVNELEQVYGGLQWDGQPTSTNVEDRTQWITLGFDPSSNQLFTLDQATGTFYRLPMSPLAGGDWSAGAPVAVSGENLPALQPLPGSYEAGIMDARDGFAAQNTPDPWWTIPAPEPAVPLSPVSDPGVPALPTGPMTDPAYDVTFGTPAAPTISTDPTYPTLPADPAWTIPGVGDPGLGYEPALPAPTTPDFGGGFGGDVGGGYDVPSFDFGGGFW